jgi:hypothetical protein
MTDDVKDFVCALGIAFDEIGDAMEAGSIGYFLEIAARAAKNEASKSGLLYLKAHVEKIEAEFKDGARAND